MKIEIATWSNGDQWQINAGGKVLAKRMFVRGEPGNIMDCADISKRDAATDAFWSINNECRRIAKGGNSGGRGASHYNSDFWAQCEGDFPSDDPRIAAIAAAVMAP